MRALSRSNNTYFNLSYRLVIATANEHLAINGEVGERMKELLTDTLHQAGGRLLGAQASDRYPRRALEIDFSYLPQKDVSGLVNVLKTVLSRKLRTEFSELFGAQSKFWADGYLLLTTASTGDETVEGYLRRTVDDSGATSNNN